jgi:fluoride exporter
MIYFAVGMGGILGALMRYYLGLSIGSWWHNSFPLATLLTNFIGCFVLGWLTTYLFKINILHPFISTGLSTGLVGSFTTFSTFSVETVHLIQSSDWVIALIYVLCSLWGGLFLSYSGYRFGQKLLKKRTLPFQLNEIGGDKK